jgi:predicted component of type VI protein secretion system
MAAMARLVLLFEGRMLDDFPVARALSIGRLPDNAVVVDDPAVSAHHARVIVQGDDVVLEDLESTNGTFVNEQPITCCVLHHRDVVLVGEHLLLFDAESAVGHPAPPDLPDWSAEPPVPRPKPTARTGVLHVIAGIADRREYQLTAQTSFIGSASHAHVRLHGWFKPSVAVAIARSSDGYVATRMGGKTVINDAPLTGRHHLQQGDVMKVGGLVLEFRWKDSQSTESAA